MKPVLLLLILCLPLVENKAKSLKLKGVKKGSHPKTFFFFNLQVIQNFSYEFSQSFVFFKAEKSSVPGHAWNLWHMLKFPNFATLTQINLKLFSTLGSTALRAELLNFKGKGKLYFIRIAEFEFPSLLVYIFTHTHCQLTEE